MPWNEEKTQSQQLSLVLKSKQFFISYAMMFTTVIYVGYVTNIFKPFGAANGHDDQFLTLASSFGLVFNLISRFSGGIILDRYRFKHFFGIALVLQIILSFTYDLFASNGTLFIVYLSSSYFLVGCIYLSMPVFYGKVFGPELGS